jgi:hypothetical protein
MNKMNSEIVLTHTKKNNLKREKIIKTMLRNLKSQIVKLSQIMRMKVNFSNNIKGVNRDNLNHKILVLIDINNLKDTALAVNPIVINKIRVIIVRQVKVGLLINIVKIITNIIMVSFRNFVL